MLSNRKVYSLHSRQKKKESQAEKGCEGPHDESVVQDVKLCK